MTRNGEKDAPVDKTYLVETPASNFAEKDSSAPKRAEESNSRSEFRTRHLPTCDGCFKYHKYTNHSSCKDQWSTAPWATI